MYWLSELVGRNAISIMAAAIGHSCSQWWWIGRIGTWQRFFPVVCVVLGGKKKKGKKRNRNNESKGQMSCQISETANCCEQSREYRWKGVARPLYLAAMLLFNLRASLVISVSAWLVRASSLNSNSWNFSLGPFSSFYFLLIISFFSESSLFSDFLWYCANL